MATKKCPNGHQYDSSIYGDNCPFCPQSGHTQVNMPGIGAPTAKTEINNNFNGNGTPGATAPTAPYYPGMPDVPGGGGGHTVIRTVGQPGSPNLDGGRKLVGLLVSYSHNPAGEVYKIYEGRNIVGRDHACDISFPMDDKMSGRHLLILYREAEGIMWANDENSSNGTYINGKFTGDRTELHTNDIIVIGSTKLVFLGVPEF